MVYQNGGSLAHSQALKYKNDPSFLITFENSFVLHSNFLSFVASILPSALFKIWGTHSVYKLWVDEYKSWENTITTEEIEVVLSSSNLPFFCSGNIH